jgi:hypothetical protein
MLDPKSFQRLLVLCLLWGLGLAGAAQAQVASDDPDWHETEVPVPPAFNRDKLIKLDMPVYVTVQFGIDPATLAITPDGIVRYVVVASNTSGSVSAMYEGIRCATGEVKTYARSSGTNPWTLAKEPQWRALNDNQPSRHALAFARQGACEGRAAAANSAADIIRAMKK